MDIGQMWGIFIYVVIAAGVCALLWWLIGYAEKEGVLKPPFNGFLKVFVAALAVAFLINLLLSFIGHGVGVPWRVR